ncbi:hypothetical protein GCM10027080_29120 [Pedococcus soli]
MLRDKIQPAAKGHALQDSDELEAHILWILRRYPAPGWEE